MAQDVARHYSLK